MPEDSSSLLVRSPQGIYCPPGAFHIDPWQPVDRAVITHAHADHARPGSRRYLTAAAGQGILQARLGSEAIVDGIPYGEAVDLNGVRVSLHPAGHLLGSAQVRVEHRGRVWVVSGDYKTQFDRTCVPFEALRCDTFVSECTFGLPVYRWIDPERVFQQVNEWWVGNQQRRRTSVIFAYALGKAQRVLANVDASLGPIVVHGAVANMNTLYEADGVTLPETLSAEPDVVKKSKGRALVVAPLSTRGSPWLRKFGPLATSVVSGWMQIRGRRRRLNVDRGFVLSDHADWDGLLSAIRDTGAGSIGLTHGFCGPMVRYLKEKGLDAWEWKTSFEGEQDDVTQNQHDFDHQRSAAGDGV